jgi:hypothetical protein
MKRIKSFESFCNESDIPNIKIDIKEILEPLKDKVDLFTTFEIDPDSFDLKKNISELYNNSDFNDFLKKKKLKKGKIESTKDFETLLDDNYILVFFFIHDKDAIEIAEPKFIFLQYYDKKKNSSSEILLFKNHENINDFYEKLTDSSIELSKGKKSYIYNTSNSGNNWDLKNANIVKGKFKQELDSDQMKKLLKNKNINVNR